MKEIQHIFVRDFNQWSNQLVKETLEIIKNKKKELDIYLESNDIKQHLWIFVNC